MHGCRTDGLDPSQVRGLQHDLDARAQRALASGLALRGRTAAHLTAMARGREYVVARYGTDQASTLSQINRLQATLEEISAKVGKRLAQPAMPRSAPANERVLAAVP